MWDPTPYCYERQGLCKRVDEECLQPIQPDSEALRGESCWLCSESCLHKRASCEAWTHVVNWNALIKKLKEDDSKLSAKLIKDHGEVIEPHREIKTIREQEIEVFDFSV